MTVRLPDFADTNCVLFTVCGAVDTAEPKAVKWLSETRELVAKTKIGGKPFVLRVITGKAPYENHLHIDLAAVDFWGKKGAPTATSKLKQIQELLEIVRDAVCNAVVEGTFVLPISELPLIVQNYIQVATTPTVVGGVRIRTTGGGLSVEGAPVNSIQWWALEKKRVMIELTGRQSLPINGEYLQASWESIESTFNKLLKGDRPNDQAKKSDAT